MERVLSSLSLISTLWFKYNRGYIDAFIPLLVTLINKKQYKSITWDNLNILSDDFEKEYGVLVPHHPMRMLLTRCAKNKILHRTSSSFFVNKNEINKNDISFEIERQIRRHNELINDFATFCLNKFNHNISNDEASVKVYSYLNTNDMNIIFLANDFSNRNKIKTKEKSDNYLVGQYILHLFSADDSKLRILVDMALGSIAAGAIKSEKLDWQNDTVRNCCFYLDTGLLIKLIGGEGELNSKIVSELIKSLQVKGGNVFVFQHVIDELEEAIESCEIWIESINFDPAKASNMAIFFRQEGYTSSDVNTLKLKAPSIIRDLNISVKSKPNYENLSKFLIDESALTTIINKLYKDNNPLYNPELFKKRTQRDVDSISAIYRLRGEIKPVQIKEARHVFLTSNGTLAYANFLYNKEKNIKKSEVLGCLSDIFIGTLIWMNSPHTAAFINQQKIIAQAYSAIRPDNNFEKKLYQIADAMLKRGLINKDDYSIITASYLTKDIVSEKTLNDPNLLTEQSISIVLDEIKARLVGSKLEELRKAQDIITEITDENKIIKFEKEKEEASFLSVIENYAKQSTEIKIFVLKFAFWILIIGPIIPAIFVKWYTIFISIITGVIAGYLSFFKSFSIEEYKKNIYQKEYDRLYQKHHK